MFLSVYIFKMDFRSKKIKIHIHLYFIATQYLRIYALCGRYRQLNSVL